MKKIKNKGFTLTEILAVIALLSMLAVLVTVGIMKYFNSGKQEYNNKLKNQLVLASKTYFAEHKEELPTTANGKGYAYVTLPAMQSNNYIAKSFVDSEGRECSPSYVYVKQKADNPNEWEYYPCLICQDKKGNKEVYSESEMEKKYCDPANWKDGAPTDPDNPDNPTGPDNPQQPDDSSKCEYERDGNDVTITNATMSTGILKIYYIDGDGVEHLVWPPEGVDPQVTVTNVPATDVGANDKIYMEDSYENKIECNENEQPDNPDVPAGAPVCSFVNVPTNWIKSATTFQAICQGQNNKQIVLNDIEKIVQGVKAYGTLTKSVSSTTDTKITFNLKFTPKSSTEGKTTVTVGEGTVKNKSDNKTNVDTAATIKSDTKAPTISFSASGTTRKATAKKDKKKGYKNKVTVKITCNDSGSGVSVFKVKIGSGSYTTVNGTTYTSTKTARGTYKYTAYCKDGAGNEKTTSKSYRVLKYSANISKCGCAKSKCTKGYYKYYFRDKRERTQSLGGRSCGYCNATAWNNLGGHDFWCTKVTKKGSYEQQCHREYVCTKYTCTKGKSCWY